MKILYDHQIFLQQKFGGISRYFNEIMRYDKSSEIIRIDPELFLPKEEVIKKDILSKVQRFIDRKTGNTVPAVKELFPKEAKDIISSETYDLFHPTYYDTYFLEIINKPFVLTVYDMIHEIYSDYVELHDGVSSKKRLLCEKSSAIIAISHKTKSDLIEIFDVPESKIYVTHLASDFDVYKPVKPKLDSGLEKYILFIGNRSIYKNFYFTVTAIADILRTDSNIHLLCTGHPFDSREIRFFEDLGVKNKIFHTYLNNDNELAWAYQNAEMFIFPSLYEGFGLPILEAFASGCPVVTSNGGSLPEVAGDAALYFDPKSALQIRDTVSAILYNHDVREKLIKKGKQRYTEFSWDKCRAETREVYNKVIGK